MRIKLPGHLIGALIVVFLVGYTFGQIVMSSKIQDVPITLVPDTRPKVPVVKIYGIENGKLIGSVSQEVRLFIDDVIAITNASGAFAVPADSLFTNFVTVQVPEGMNFVASKRGKYYYSVTSSKGEGNSVKNRVYFPDEESAQEAGFVKSN